MHRKNNLRRFLVCSLASLGLLQFAGPVSAIGLVQTYEEALQNDPTYRSAIHENEAGKQNLALGRSNLMPNLSFNYSASKNRADVTAPNFLGQQTTTYPVYNSVVAQLILKQPVINLDGLARYYIGKAQVKFSDAQFSARTKDLALRVVGAYTDVKYAEDQLALATAQRDAFAEQMKVNERLFQKGEGTKTDMLETQAKFDFAEAQVLEARDIVQNARNTLAAIVGKEVTDLDSLTADFKVKPMQPSSYDEWQALALERNAEIAAQRYSLEGAEYEVKRNYAGYAPRLDFQASYNKNKSETINTYNQDSIVRTVGVQLVIPIYSGGYVSAATSQAISNREKAKSDLEFRTRQVLVELRKQYNLMVSSTSKINALSKAVDSARLSVQANEKSVKSGLRINLDVLNAYEQLYLSQRDLARARYDYLLAYLRLRNAAGTLGVDDLNNVAGYFVASR